MFLDASIVVEILAREEDWQVQAAKLEPHHGRLVHSPMVRFEAVLALARLAQRKSDRSPDTEVFARVGQLFDEFVTGVGSKEIEISSEIGHGALYAASTYGKVVGHKADLNLGDCFSYACAKSLGIGLLYKGNDFALTDLA